LNIITTLVTALTIAANARGMK